MTSLSFQTVVQKNETSLSSCVQFENKMASYCALLLNKAQLPLFKLFLNIVTYRVTSYRALFSDNARLSQWEIPDTMF